MLREAANEGDATAQNRIGCSYWKGEGVEANETEAQRWFFAAAPLWITAYDRHELRAAGDYPNQSHGGDGLPAFAARHRPVENADLVLWYTMGFHHLTRPEDWPVLPTIWHSIELAPSAFFDRNPSLPPERDR